jgi:hypothetical protein
VRRPERTACVDNCCVGRELHAVLPALQRSGMRRIRSKPVRR